jgi:hypothetical protein
MEFKIGIVGPSRIGKTTLISSILESSQELLAGESASIGYHDNITQKRINKFKNERNGYLMAGEFNPGGLEGTSESFHYNLKLSSNNSDSSNIKLSFMDYPGGWLTGDLTKWQKDCEPFLKESHVLIIPVDAALLMSADTNKKRGMVSGLLSIAEIEDVARIWAKERAISKTKALLLFLPVKCESYFSDNGGLTDNSDTLYSNVTTLYYKSIIETVKSEFKENRELLNIVYSPIDTYGCLEIKETNWSNDNFEADYKLRQPNRINQKGADSILISISKMIINLAKSKHEENTKEKENEKDFHLNKMNKDEGIFMYFWNKFTGEEQRRKNNFDEANTHYMSAQEAKDATKEILELFDDLSKKQYNERVREIG